MRLIDADGLKDVIVQNVYPLVDAFNSHDYGMFWTGGIEKAIDEQPTVNPWIPCSERLPKIEREGQRRGWYITTNEYGSVGETQYEFYDDLLKTGWQSSNQILAWMPMPEPWKEDGEV